MDQIQLARSVEEANYRSWKARECVEYDGWQLRFADGFSRRGNSVYPAAVSQLPHEEKLAWCRQFYAERGLDLVVRQTVATEPGLDDVLDEAGFTLEGRTNVMVAGLERQTGGVAVSDLPSSQWWDTTSSLWGFDLSDPSGWRGIIGRIDLPAGFVCANGRGAGLGVVDGEWLGLFEIIVGEGERRSGLGTSLTQSLMGWGHRMGARRAYLQVVAENQIAIDFYTTLGFELGYGYWYRRSPV